MKPKVKIRESNFELLRLIAMIMVIVVHVDFGSVGWPTATDLQDQFSTTVMKILVESFCIVCVDVFVLISGWFGIRPSAKKLAGFFFQCVLFHWTLVGLPSVGGGKDFQHKGNNQKLYVLGILVCARLSVPVDFVSCIELLYRERGREGNKNCHCRIFCLSTGLWVAC